MLDLVSLRQGLLVFPTVSAKLTGGQISKTPKVPACLSSISEQDLCSSHTHKQLINVCWQCLALSQEKKLDVKSSKRCLHKE